MVHIQCTCECVQLIPGQHIKSLSALFCSGSCPIVKTSCPSFNLMLCLGSEQSTQNHGTPRRESRQKVRGKTAGFILFICIENRFPSFHSNSKTCSTTLKWCLSQMAGYQKSIYVEACLCVCSAFLYTLCSLQLYCQYISLMKSDVILMTYLEKKCVHAQLTVGHKQSIPNHPYHPLIVNIHSPKITLGRKHRPRPKGSKTLIMNH